MTDESKIPIDGTVNHPKPVHRVSVRGGFSDRNGIKPENTTMQMKSFDTRTRTQMINLMDRLVQSYLHSNDERVVPGFVYDINSNIYTREIGNGYTLSSTLKLIDETLRADDYDSVLTVIEYVSRRMDSDFHLDGLVYEMFNDLFQREYVGYRFIDGMITPITAKEEAEAIEEAIKGSDEAIRIHLRKALNNISDRETPDYENSIKESISAVEAECCRIVGKKATLGDALKMLEDAGIVIHKALRGAFNNLYGYTCDAKGVRHAGDLGGANATFAEAQFMLVSCSAFINYLKTCGAD